MKSPQESAGRALPLGRRALLSSLLIPAIPRMPSVRQEPLLLTKGLAIGGVSRGGRRPFLEDAVQKAMVLGKWLPPSPGDEVTLPGGATRKWETIEADKDGWFQGRVLAGGYLYATWETQEERTCLLVAQGNGMVYVNGEPRAGDAYSYGTLALPVRLRKGANSFLFAAGRGRIHAQLLPVTAGVILRAEDNTLPDLIVGETATLWGAIHIVNAQDTELTGLTLKATVEGASGSEPHSVETRLPPLPPMTVRKTGFRFAAPRDLPDGKATLRLEVTGRVSTGGVAPVTVEVRVRKPDETYKRTFVSDIDGTVQYYGVRPALKPSPKNAFILTLHGASVEAIGQADAYGSKDWVTLVAPTNRRPYGFDWEDWGRWDALEVLEVAQKQFPHDPARVSLTGHSMGGHGTWSIGSLFPDRFAAIGPSAGWISFNTYGGGRPRGTDGEKSPVTALIERAANQTDTLLWVSNLLSLPVYILHGDADDNVPVSEARTMRDRLRALKHPALQMHEQPGAGHWWDVSPEPGADCVDWKPMFALFQESRIGPVAWDGSPDTVRFTTVSPAVADRFRWARVLQQEKMLLPSVVDLKWEPGSGTVRGTTQNVAFLTLDASLLVPHAPLRRLEIDGQALDLPERVGQGVVPLRRVGERWQVAGSLPSANDKSPERGSGFKQAFRHRFVLVFGTQGTPEENAWAYSRVRFDAESFLYRGNGSPEMVADRAFDERTFRDRSVILYGNATTNALWQRLLKDSPVVVERGKLRAGNREWTGEDVATVFLRPRPDSKNAMVAAVGASGMAGLRLTDRLPYFVSGVAYPDWCVFDTTVLEKGAEGVRAAGYFGNDWRLESGESVYR